MIHYDHLCHLKIHLFGLYFSLFMMPMYAYFSPWILDAQLQPRLWTLLTVSCLNLLSYTVPGWRWHWCTPKIQPIGASWCSKWVQNLGHVQRFFPFYGYFYLFFHRVFPAIWSAVYMRPCTPWRPNSWAATRCTPTWAWAWWPPPSRWAAFAPPPCGRCSAAAAGGGDRWGQAFEVNG